jgi:hypothetical protein
LLKNAILTRTFHFHFNARLGAPSQAVLQHDKTGQQHIALKWEWNQACTSVPSS